MVFQPLLYIASKLCNYYFFCIIAIIERAASFGFSISCGSCGSCFIRFSTFGFFFLGFPPEGGALRFFFELFLAFFAGFTRVCGLRRFLDTSVSSKPCAFAVNSLCSSKCANLDASSSQLQLQPSGDEATSLALHSSHFLHCRNASSSLDYATSREPEASHQSPER